jgi:hypothetical protein
MAIIMGHEKRTVSEVKHQDYINDHVGTVPNMKSEIFENALVNAG